jgi:hypothetical protein
MASSAARLIVGCLASPDRAVNCIREGFQFGVHDRGHSGHGLPRPRRKARHPRATAWRSLVGWGEWLRRAVAGGCSWAFFMPLSLKSLSNLTRERERNGGS